MASNALVFPSNSLAQMQQIQLQVTRTPFQKQALMRAIQPIYAMEFGLIWFMMPGEIHNSSESMHLDSMSDYSTGIT
jgi:hypothetical protein